MLIKVDVQLTGQFASKPTRGQLNLVLVNEQIAPIAAVMNATSVHSLQQRTTPNPLSCPGLTPCVSSGTAR